MNFREWLNTPLFGRKALTASPGVLEIATARQLTPFIPLGGTNLDPGRINSVYVEAQNASYGWMYRYQPSVRTVIEYLARNVSQLSLKVFERIDDDAREHRGDHPAAVLLRKPNPFTPGPQFIYELLTDFLIYDNAYALKLRNPQTGTFDNIFRIEPPMVGLIGRTHFSPEGYRIYQADGNAFDVPPEDMIHWRGYNPSDPRKGESKLETLREILAADLASRKAVTELARTGLTMPGWIQRPLEAPPLTDDALGRLRTSVANQAKSAKREYPILEEGMEFKQGGVTPEDAQFIAARAAAIEEVNAIFGLQNVPPRNEEERKHVYADVLPPYTTVIASFLNLQILQQEYDADDHYFEFGKEKLMDEIYKTLTSASGRPVLLTNEARAKIDEQPVPGGDELVTPQNVTIGGKPSTGVMPIQNPNGPPQDGSHRTEDAPTPPGKALNGNGHVEKALLVPRRIQEDHRRDGWAKKYDGRIQVFLERQERATKSKKTKTVATERWNKELAKELDDLYVQHFAAEGGHASFRWASSFDPEQGRNWLKVKAAEVAAGINAITQEHITSDGIEQAFAHAKEVRAVAAGMTMATDVAGFAVRVAEEQAPGDREVTIDGGSCDICAPHQGTFLAKDLDEWPAFHPGCVCVCDPS